MKRLRNEGLSFPKWLPLIFLAGMVNEAGAIGQAAPQGASARILQTFRNDYPAGIILGPDGAIWTVDALAGVFYRIEDGAIQSFAVTPPDVLARPTNGPDGNIWYTTGDGVQRMTTSGVVKSFHLSNVWPRFIAAGPDGNMWFTEFEVNRIGRITTSGQVTEFPVPTPSAGVFDIAGGPDGSVWFTESFTNKIGRISPSGTVTEFRLPAADGYPEYISPGSDGNVWFTEFSPTLGPRVGRITPAGDISEFFLPAGANSIDLGPDGHLWLGNWGIVMRVAPSGAVTTISLPDTIRPIGFAFPPDGTVWIASAGDDFSGLRGGIIQICVDGSACDPEAALRLHDGRFALTVDWKKADGSTGPGHGVALSRDAGYFWFFNAANLEMVVKVLDGCTISGSRWFFAAGLTNVEVSMTVTDTETGEVKTYVNPPGTPFAPVQDTSAFPCE